ncbi:MAG TPA: hypothetical protein VLR90_01940 [Blastocatellia bacterium]|nr:hypothetical protein [Blastocatellia bacterium]
MTLTLDSGVWYSEEVKPGSFIASVGYFNPDIMIYVDGELAARIEPAVIGTEGHIVEVRHLAADGRDLGNGITGNPGKYLFALKPLYPGRTITFDRSRFHNFFSFNSGHFVGTKIKERWFKEAVGVPYQLTGRRQSAGRIAHDLDAHYELGAGESMVMMMGGKTLWTSTNHPRAAKRFDIQVMADNTTDEMFYGKAIGAEDGQTYWLPNSGDPPPQCPEPPCEP